MELTRRSFFSGVSATALATVVSAPLALIESHDAPDLRGYLSQCLQDAIEQAEVEFFAGASSFGAAGTVPSSVFSRV